MLYNFRLSRRTLLRAVSCLTGQFGISPDRRQGADVWLQNHLRGPGKNPAVCMVLPECRCYASCQLVLLLLLLPCWRVTVVFAGDPKILRMLCFVLVDRTAGFTVAVIEFWWLLLKGVAFGSCFRFCWREQVVSPLVFFKSRDVAFPCMPIRQAALHKRGRGDGKG